MSEQLAKVELAQRLFIEPDVLLSELRPYSPISKMKDPRMEISRPKQTSAFLQPIVKDESVLKLKEVVVASSKVIDTNDDMDEATEIKSNILPNSHKSVSSFKDFQAEAELDMLLDSLGGTDVPHSSQIPSGQLQSLAAIQTSKNMSGIDDAIDNLLSSNSNMRYTAPALYDSIDNLLSSTSNVTQNSPGVDEKINDLLNSTSYLAIQDNTLTSRNVATTNAETAKSLSLGSKAKLVDDFDSWFETF